MHNNTAHERDNALALLTQVQSNYVHVEERIGDAIQMRDEAMKEVAKVAGERNDLIRERDEITHKLTQAMLELKTTRPKSLEERVSPAKQTRLEARVKILQAENDALRGEMSVLRRRQKELGESLAMATEEGRGTRAEMLQIEG